MSTNYQKMFKEIVTILRRDYAGRDIMGDRFSPRYYTQAIGQAWNDSKLDDLLFLRYINQMLACIGDRRLSLDLRPSEDYTPSSPGFYTRRYGDDLFVTAVTGESRLSVGDRIVSVNGGSPAKHKGIIQKDFFRGSVPEREDWNGLLKMADYIDVIHGDGSEERIFLQKFPPVPPELTPLFSLPEDGVAYMRPGPFVPGADTAAFVASHEKELKTCRAMILDLRNARGNDEEEILPLLPWLCREERILAALMDEPISVNYTRLNCILKAAGLQDIPEAADFVQELVAKTDSGFVEEVFSEEENPVQALAPEKVIVLTDTWCRDAGETLVRAARRAGATILGRPTLGTLSTLGEVRYELNERFILTWPTAVSNEAIRGHILPGDGITPDEYIPWTPDECSRDLLLETALAYINGK